MAQRHSFFLSFVLIAFLVLAWAGVALGENRGITVKIRASNDANAPVSESVKLYDSSYALVIGIDNYTAGWPKLKNAIADAKEVAAELEKRGFEVTFKENLDSANLRETLREFFLKGQDPNARLFLWYAGHGHSLKDEGFLVPADAPPPTARKFKLKSIHMREFGSLMRLAESKHVFAVFDSCFSGTIFKTRAGMVPAAVTHATTKPVRQFLASGDANQEVRDDGTFRKVFLSALRGESRADANGDGYLLGSELGLYLYNEVTNYTEEAQTPLYGKLQDPDFNLGDFVFLLPDRGGAKAASTEGPKEGATKATAQTGEDKMVEIAFWASIAAGDDPAEFENYLEKYPKGDYVTLARHKIETLRAPKPVPPEDKTSAATVTKGEKQAKVQEKKEEETHLRIGADAKLVQASEKSQQQEWSPVAPSQAEKPFVIAAATGLDQVFAGTGKPTVLKKGTEAPQAAGMKDGYAIAPDAWALSDPQGDSLYKVDGRWIHMKANGGHNIWDCNRDLAPILWVNTPGRDSWTAQVKFELAARIGNTHVGLVVWNGREERPVNALYFGPVGTNQIQVAGSYRDGCRSGPGHLSKQKGSTGDFALHYTGTRGWLRICRQGDRFTFYFKSPFKRQWLEVGSLLTEAKDGFSRVGLITKTWRNEPVQVSFADFRIMPGLTGVKRWQPAYFRRLEESGEATFRDKDFTDFEWSDPQGDSVHEIVGSKVMLKANGGHSIWDCNRELAPILSVETPPADTWTAQVEFEMPSRIGNSQVGLVLWDGAEQRPVHALYFGPSGTNEIEVAGSYRDGCRSGPGHLAQVKGSSGDFRLKYDRTRGWLRITKQGNLVSFYFKSPHKKQWRKIGSLLTTVKDGFDRIGLMAKTWRGEPVQTTFSDFTLMTGVAGARRWIPDYFARLKSGKPELFSGRDFVDFEWSDPQGDSVHEIVGARVKLKANGGHSIWDCNRELAPMLTVEAPPRDTWVTQVDFNMPSRVGNSHVGLVLWNGAEERPVHALYFGPTGTNEIQIAGSYRDGCRSGPDHLAKVEGNQGQFRSEYKGTSGRLRIIKTGPNYRFAFWSPESKKWEDMGNVETTVKDNFKRIGLIAKTWRNEPAEVEFANFMILPGAWR